MPTTASTSLTTVTDLLTHLVRMPTISGDHTTSRAALDWIEQQLHGLPLHTRRYEHNGFPSLIATTRPHVKNPKLWLSAHLDVVPGVPKTFQPAQRHGKLYGRGIYDMKFAIAIFITLLQEIGPNLPQYDLGLMITSDEEVGGYDGVKWLINDLGYRGQAVFTPDSGSSWEMEMGAKGITWWELTATGRAVHASRVWNGVNAVDEIIKFVDHLRSHLIPEPCGLSEHPHTTINLGTFTTNGNAINQVPDSATARLDIRISPQSSYEEVATWFQAAQIAVPTVTATLLLNDPSYSVDPAAKPVVLFQKIANDILGFTPKSSIAHGTSDARHFAARGIPTITVCPTGSGFHVPNEWVDIADLGRFQKVTREFVEQWSKKA